MSQETIGIIGCGNMGGAIYRSLKNRKKNVLGFDPYLPAEKAEGILLENNWEEFQKKSELLLISVKPGDVSKTLKTLDSPKKILSVAAGIDTIALRDSAPKGSKVVRIMPNLPILVEKGALGYFGDSELYPTVREIFSPISYCLEVSKEELLDSVTGLSGSGPAYVFRFIQSLAEGGVASGLTYSQSLELSIHTVLGAASLLMEEREKNPDLHPEELKNRVTSPGGTTIAGLEELEKNKFAYSILAAVKRATERSKELGKS
ncbi:pyrroline-5-carboxylate reductase [Leptospira fainei serovar Hurstbridge str. BUT 6]|uniref:Pyrroline-5-carboxylate reductase n=1 Tax=Leptospira fainei serovar Hurstbridge str. BUT 6 TaxID=1193011 RepID=S3V434_9LEPT|nr:pyrroline-5-carboxylate reductase [Leptospira fainei]EPG76188.1 pyrroline-5-carboxylate reductase [Leptospira fainei serovar Hurstbridge str. BUT 6]